jgi:hypothetical protein
VKSLIEVEVAMRVFNFLIYTYMFVLFVKVISFFRNKKEEKLTRLQRYMVSCKHSSIVFGSQLVGFLNLIENLLTLVYPISSLFLSSSFNRYQVIFGFIMRQVIDFLTSLSCLYLFYSLGMRRVREKAKTRKRAVKEVMRNLL